VNTKSAVQRTGPALKLDVVHRDQLGAVGGRPARLVTEGDIGVPAIHRQAERRFADSAPSVGRRSVEVGRSDVGPGRRRWVRVDRRVVVRGDEDGERLALRDAAGVVTAFIVVEGDAKVVKPGGEGRTDEPIIGPSSTCRTRVVRGSGRASASGLDGPALVGRQADLVERRQASGGFEVHWRRNPAPEGQ